MVARGIHTKPVRGLSNDWITPPEIILALGKFDMDPCAHPKQFYKTAARMVSPPNDGLIFAWLGRIWLNPPYGEGITPWLEKLVDHGNGVALVPARTDVEKWFWPFVWEAAAGVLFLRGRLYFRRPDGRTEGNAGHGSCLVAYGIENLIALERCGLAGKLVKL